MGFALFLLAIVAYVAMTSIATYATSALPRWYGHLGVVVALLALGGSAGAIWAPPLLAGGGIISCVAVGAFFAWCLVLAVVFLRTPPAPTHA